MSPDTTPTLAINGGPKTKTTPYGTGKRYLDNEIKYLQEALEQNTLFYGFGSLVKRACARMQAYTAWPYIVPCSSGSAAVHLGLIAAGIGPGDEVIVTPNTDTGSVLGILEEGAVPIFCDPDFTLQPTAEGVAARITPRTRAVVVVHLAGYPAPVDEIVALCQGKGIPVVEDCAQSWGARLHGQLVGTFGVAGCYSTNDFKHISTGEGGFVALRDADLYRRVSNYSDKYYDRLFDRTQNKAHHGVNYRMTELQGAVALAQLEKVDAITAHHHDLGVHLEQGLSALAGAQLVRVVPDGYSSYWWTVLWVDETQLTASRDQVVAALQAEGLTICATYAKYDLIQAPLFQTRQVRPWLPDARSAYPLLQPDGRDYRYSLQTTPRHQRMLESGIAIWLNTFHTLQDMQETAAGILKVFRAYAR
jgi:perosamine synthetase